MYIHVRTVHGRTYLVLYNYYTMNWSISIHNRFTVLDALMILGEANDCRFSDVSSGRQGSGENFFSASIFLIHGFTFRLIS